jgi:hypothetical protein
MWTCYMLFLYGITHKPQVPGLKPGSDTTCYVLFLYGMEIVAKQEELWRS